MKLTPILLIALALCGCTVIPKTPQPAVASWDGSEQNSGLLGALPDHSAIITGHAEARYIALCAQYGYKFHPPLTGGEATPYTNLTLRLDAQHYVDFATMELWKRKAK